MSNRELAFCLAGLVIGTLLGYYIRITWEHVPRHMHHIKAIICHHYIGIEVLYEIKNLSNNNNKVYSKLISNLKIQLKYLYYLIYLLNLL